MAVPGKKRSWVWMTILVALACAVGMGAEKKGKRFWSFRPLKNTVPPPVRRTDWCKSPVDRFVLHRLERESLSPSPRADRRTLIRRASFDLTGLPPTPGEIASFLGDKSTDAFRRLIDRLLASPAYGQRWGRHWLDVVRYADARDLIQLPAGSDFREIWRYRDWVVKSFNRDMPYRDFVRYQIAGDLLQPRAATGQPQRMNKDAYIATGMLALADFVPGDVDKDLMVADYVDDMINVVGQGVMGLTLACARCHEHKYDPISTEDYYALAGIFFSTSLVRDIPKNPGNTPLVRVDLLTQSERQRVNLQSAADKKRLAELSKEYSKVSAKVSSFEVVSITWGTDGTTLHRNGTLSGNNKTIDAISNDPGIRSLRIGEAGSGKVGRFRGLVAEIRVYDRQLNQQERAGVEAELFRSWFTAAKQTGSSKISGQVLRLRGEDPGIQVNKDQRVTLWPDRAGSQQNALPVRNTPGPRIIKANINGRRRQVLSFVGSESLQAPLSAPSVGSVFLVFSTTGLGKGERLIGWEDSQVGRHGLGLMILGKHSLHAILRNRNRSGDIISNERKPIPSRLLSSPNRKDLGVLRRLQKLEQLRKDLQQKLGNKNKSRIPQAVVVEDGGPIGTRHAGFQDSHVFKRGNHKSLGPKVPRGFPRVLRRADDPVIQSGSGRLELANWLTRNDHPLTARVIVNRIWLHHFGEGLVRTPNNFGFRGDLPSHPKLLDFLTARFIESGWSIKSIHQLIMNSAVYQQQSGNNARSRAKDPKNLLLWRTNRRRLQAESIRDSLLAAAGRIDFAMGGPGFQDLSSSRRSLYLMTARTGAKTSGFGSLFDRADCGAIVGKRSQSTVAPQALFLMNDPFTAKQANELAKRIQIDKSLNSRKKQIHRLYEIALGRPATMAEITISARVLQQATESSGADIAWQRLCLILLCTNEFIYID